MDKKRTTNAASSQGIAVRWTRVLPIVGLLLAIAGCGYLSAAEDASKASIPVTSSGTSTPAAGAAKINPTLLSPGGIQSESRGYLTTPQELALIRQKANQGIEPYAGAVAATLDWAEKRWSFTLGQEETCPSSEDPAWINNEGGIPILYAKALAYHLTGNTDYADQVKTILQQVMTRVLAISIDDQQCRLNFSWGTPELVASADLIEAYWKNLTCTGPTSSLYGINAIGKGSCKVLFQNWLVKNPYYIVSLTAEESQSNWGAAATNTLAYIADYLWDRPDVRLITRNPLEINGGLESSLTSGQAFAHAKQLAFNRMSGLGIEYASNSSCDYLDGPQQSSQWTPVKSQITEKGIIPEDARRAEYCNIPQYDGDYENYPQVHLGQVIQQCELLLRRGDRSCYDHVDKTDIPEFSFIDPIGIVRTTHLYPGRGSIERAIKAIIVDSQAPWKHDSALEVAYRYYYNHHTLSGFREWQKQLDHSNTCSQDICFGTLTHGFSPGENLEFPPIVPPPQ